MFNQSIRAAELASGAGQSAIVTVVIAAISSGIVATLINTITGNLKASADYRRDRYAEAIRYLVAWSEYPYRIRRRTDDEPATLAALAERGHALQEQRAAIAAWIASESRVAKLVFDDCTREISTFVGPACAMAWRSAPITAASDMVLGKSAQPESQIAIQRMEHMIRHRFGLYRLMWRTWVLKRIEKGIKTEDDDLRTSAENLFSRSGPASTKRDSKRHQKDGRQEVRP
ncbi:hypothetical protein O7623_14370 [Solwaraspora sp. WMMD791]|uniref:hypothetical protein n=1 Tax=Solwaraspora sp. WMMD791 TaxID=3016086 RepID=UPI002499C74F|nr:hypothetical protein [Solwaraspora sp. WMMD791]WFE30292.1 hypothetical protein O7623_14370 [Solwaraspora sp. WMMD791]